MTGSSDKSAQVYQDGHSLPDLAPDLSFKLTIEGDPVVVTALSVVSGEFLWGFFFGTALGGQSPGGRGWVDQDGHHGRN